MLSKEELKYIFENEFNPESWKRVLVEVFGLKRYNLKPQKIGTTPNDWEAEGFELGNFVTIEGRLVGVYEVNINERVKLQYNKVGLRNLLKPIYSEDVDAALVVFSQKKQWRFSYVSEINIKDKETGKREKKSTDPKRYTYLFGEGQKCRTAAELFGKIQQQFNLFGGVVKLEEIEKAFSVDSLTKDFYRELSDWYFRALQEVEFPDDAEKNATIRNSSNTIRLITRLIFVWFLKQKGFIPGELFDRKEIEKIINFKDKTGSTYYKAILQNLFFATLNTEMNDKERRFINRQQGVQGFYRYERFFKNSDRFFELTKNIPFLNGGLFENLDKNVGEENEIRIDCFSNRLFNETRLKVPDSLFFDKVTSDLSGPYLDKKKKQQEVRGIIDIFQSYNFTIEENTPFEIEIALDPELLGKVFENLLASYVPETETTARKMTGSFYTPREVVDYMVDESLKGYLLNCLDTQDSDITKQNLDHLFSYTSEQTLFNQDECNKLIYALDHCNILDPACGSGAFPMGILHKMVFLLNKLDENNNKWKELQREKAIKETEDAFKAGDKEEREQRLLDISQSFEENNDDYGRKLFLIENCIYGVDIQPIAVQIVKLRFFISLIVDQEIDRRKKNLGVRPLPNLETKFVAANTLLSLNRKQLSLRNTKIDRLEKELREVRHKHFSARTPVTKKKYRDKDKELRESIGELLKHDGWENTTAESIAHWNAYDQNASADFFDNEWMFGLLEGFNILIGNPPYILIQKLVLGAKIKSVYNSYQVAQYKTDLYHLFIQRGIDLLSKGNGVISYITSNAFLKNKHNNKLRKYIIDNVRISKVILFYKKVFENASVDNTIFLFDNFRHSTDLIDVIEIRSNFEEDVNSSVIHFHQRDILAPFYPFNFDLSSESEVIIKKIETNTWTLREIGRAYFGIQTFDRNKFVSKIKTLKTHKPVIDGGNIKKYFLINPEEFVDFQKENIKSGGNIDFYRRERIVVRQIGDFPYGTLCPSDIFTLNTVYNIFLKRDDISLKYVLGIINSRLIRYYWMKLFYDNKATFPKIKKDALESIPIKMASQDVRLTFDIIVDYVLLLKRIESRSATFFENLIDAMVYELYFSDEVYTAKCETIKYAAKLPVISQYKDEKEKVAVVEEEFRLLNKLDHPVRLSLFNLDTIEEIAIIEGKKK